MKDTITEEGHEAALAGLANLVYYNAGTWSGGAHSSTNVTEAIIRETATKLLNGLAAHMARKAHEATELRSAA